MKKKHECLIQSLGETVFTPLQNNCSTNNPITLQLNSMELKFPRVFGQTFPAATRQTVPLFGQSAPQTKAKRDTYQ